LSPTADFAAFKKKARAFLVEHEDHVALRKLRSGKPLTELDISELERMLVDAGIGSDADIETARGVEAAQVRGFGVFLRSLVGLDRSAAQAHFAEFISDGASADQIEFISMVIEHVTKNGVMDPGLLYDSPFTDCCPDGPYGIFQKGMVHRLEESVRAVNHSATISRSAEAS
jgi:type I restriction enzyme, R subunit